MRRRLANAGLSYRLAGYAALAGLAALIVLCGWLPGAFLNLGLAAAGVGIPVFLLVRYFRRRERFRGRIEEAFAIEGLAGNLNSRLVSALDFLGHPDPSPLMQVVVTQAEADCEADFEARLDRSGRDRFRRRFLLLAVLLLVAAANPWFGLKAVVANLRDSYFVARDALFPVVYRLEPGPGRHIFRTGKEVEVAIAFARRGLREVVWVEEGPGGAVRGALPVDAAGRAARRLAGQAEGEWRVRFEFAKRISETVEVVFANPPVLEDMQAELVYPPYTRMLPRTVEGVQTRLFGLPGTRMTIGLTFSKTLSVATLTFDDGGELALDVVGRFASTSLVHSQARTARLQVVDEHGLGLEAPVEIAFELQRDEPPQVILPRSLTEEMPTLAEGLKLFGFGVRLQDDFGVDRCVLKWTRSTIENPNRILDQGEVERLVSPPRRQVVESFQKVFESVPATPGDRISFRVEVYDNRRPDSQKAVSAAKSLFVHQEGLDELRVAALRFGGDALARARIAKSKRATSVKEPMATRTTEKVWNEYDAPIHSTVQAPVVRGLHAQAVKDYFRLVSGAVEGEDGAVAGSAGPDGQPAAGAAPDR
ncbi:MAG: hypothetical protein BWZ02_01570 [Lentisphaerae bacterium ADurb.BinA184]|nr:MAG: hypothetical protein BWZ02_01570 [Lentisphaerae bacterium ADurb.BinA184]